MVGSRAGGLKHSWSGSKTILLALVLVGLPIGPPYIEGKDWWKKEAGYSRLAGGQV